MWLNDDKISDSAISAYREALLTSCPNHIVIDNLFDQNILNNVIQILHQPHCWTTQRHTYSKLYVDDHQWHKTEDKHRFVQRDCWQRSTVSATNSLDINSADEFLTFLRSEQFMSLLSRIFNVLITDMNVEDPAVNSNYFRLNTDDFIEQHADDSPGREVCMLLYLNKDWDRDAGGELVFSAEHDQPISIAPLYNRCVLFNPSSKGSEHWVKKVTGESSDQYRYNITSWYWSE